MKITIEEGRQVVELRPEPAARLFAAGFLAFWLFGWTMGELFGLGLLASAGDKIGLVVLGISIWTVGGVLAAFAAARSIWGVDRIEFDVSGVRVIARLATARRMRSFERDRIRTVVVRRNGVALETSRGIVVLTRFGALMDHDRLRAEIAGALKLGADATTPIELPKGWESTVDTEGVPVLRKSALARRWRAGFMTLLFLALAVGAARLGAPAADGSLRSWLSSWMSPMMLSLLAAVVGGIAAWWGLGGEAVRLRR